jgi:hypothetical protein
MAERHITGVLRLAALAALLTTSTVSAQIIRPIGPAAPPTTIAPAIPTPGVALINGSAVDAGAMPLPGASVHLRNLTTNLVESQAVANPSGGFTFSVRPELPYVVEVADAAGRVVAVSDVVVAQAGDVASTVVEVPMRATAVAGVFTNTAGSVVSAASGAGVTVVQSAVLPFVSPEQ